MSYLKWKVYFLLLFILFGCSSQVIKQTTTPTVEDHATIPFFAAQLRPTFEPRPYPAAVHTGILRIEGSCLRFQGSNDPQSFLVIWLSEVHIQPDRIIDMPNQKMVLFGTEVSLGGGAINSTDPLFAELRMPIPDECSGPYWLAGGIQ